MKEAPGEELLDENNELCQNYMLRGRGSCYCSITWWRHDMETLSLWLALCEGNPPVTGGFTSQRASNAAFDVFFDARQNE